MGVHHRPSMLYAITKTDLTVYRFVMIQPLVGQVIIGDVVRLSLWSLSDI